MDLSAYRAVLFDLDGVLYVGRKMIGGADRTIQSLQAQGMTIAGVTNTTTTSRRMVAKKLMSMGIPLQEEHIYTPAALARKVIGDSCARLYIRKTLHEDFAGIQECKEKPDYIVMGDIGGEGYPPEVLRDIFQYLMQGSKILALHKNRFWQKEDGLHLDLGCFVSAVEYAAHTQARVLGKPSKDFFCGVCQALNTAPAESLMVGDDIESDILGAHQASLSTVLVKTGKYRKYFVQQVMQEYNFQADYILESVASLRA